MPPRSFAFVAVLLLCIACNRDQSARAPDKPAADSIPSVIRGGAADSVEHVVQVATGAEHACAITSVGTAWCWGRGDSYLLGAQLDSESVAAVASPVRVAGSHQFKSIAAGSTFTCAVAYDGRAMCWGRGTRGELGGGRAAGSSREPVSVVDGRVFSTITAGDAHVCALDAAGDAWCWGENANGQLGDGSRRLSWRPERVSGGLKFRHVAAAGQSTCADTTTGQGYCWGLNDHGQLGNGNTETSERPVPVFGISNLRLVRPGVDASCAVEMTGALFCWGDNAFGQLAIGSREPQLVTPTARVQTYEKFVDVQPGQGRVCALPRTGQVYCWGASPDSGLGVPTDSVCAVNVPCASRPRTVPSAVLRQISMYHDHVCGAGVFQPAFCWGRGLAPDSVHKQVAVLRAPQTIYVLDPDVARYNSADLRPPPRVMPESARASSSADSLSRNP